MAISPLQSRAERAAERFVAARKPVVIEFSGVPKAGKTTTLTELQVFLKRCGFRVEVVIERASICPIRDKKHANFNVWTACMTLAQILEKTQTPPRGDDPQILILDRGLFDSICWLTIMERLARLKTADRQAIESFLRIDDWKKRITGVFVMTVSPQVAMERERGYLRVESPKGGSIMNLDVLQKTLETTRETASRLKRDFRIHEIDTTAEKNPQKTLETVVDIVLNWVEEQLQEDILSLPKTRVAPLFRGHTCLGRSDGEVLARAFVQEGTFRPRDEVEKDAEVVQALPVVVVRNRTGDILRLRRRERYEEDLLHNKIVIWAGGHVRKEDATNGDSLLQCAVRELQEELRLSVQTDTLKFLGAVWVDNGTRTAQHLALVYEWRAETDDVAVALSSAEFFERRGNSLSGSFVNLDELVRGLNASKVTEVWSAEIVRGLLAKNSDQMAPRLF